MPLQGNATENAEKSKSLSLSVVKDEGSHVATGTVFMNNYRNKNPVTSQTISTTYSAVGAQLGMESSAGNAMSVTAQHIPKFGNQIRADATANLSRGDNHSVNLNTFTTRNMPIGGPNFSTHGVGLDAQVGKVGANASVAHTPMFKTTEQSLGARLNLHQSPTGSANVGVGVSRVVTPSARGPWEKGVFFNLTKDF